LRRSQKFNAKPPFPREKNHRNFNMPNQSSVHQLENLLFFTLIQLIAIIVMARVANIVARKVGQPGAVGEMMAGIILGPSLLGALFPDTFKWLFKSVSAEPITIMSQIGLTLLMFQIGMDFEFKHLKTAANRRAMLGITIGSITLPFALGFALGHWSHPYLAPDIAKLPYCLFAAVALSITAVPILGRILREFDLNRHKVGVIAITAAAANDVVGWFLLAVISALSLAQFSAAKTMGQLALIVAFMLVCWFVVRPILVAFLRRYRFENETLPPTAMTVILAAIMFAGICTYKLGIFAIFGGFILGTLVHDLDEFVNAWRKQVGQFVLVFFLPIFFTYTGLRTNIAGLDSIALWQWAVAFFAVAVIGKILGAYIGARMGQLNHQEALTIGYLMNTRALMELIVLNIGYDLGFIPQSLFTMLVMMAIGTTIMTGPLLRLSLPKMGHVVPKGIEA
jgi:Kef-type K+ transport system membrane component KefB